MRNRLWFFTAGRLQNTAEGRTLATTNGAYDFSNVLRRYEGKGDLFAEQPEPSRERLPQVHRAADERVADHRGWSWTATACIDSNRDMNLFTVNYYGILTPRLSVEARYSVRNETIKNFGSRSTDPRRRHAAPRRLARVPALLGADLLRRLRSGGTGQPESVPQGIVLSHHAPAPVPTTRSSATTASTIAGSRTTINPAATIGSTAPRRSSPAKPSRRSSSADRRR